MTQLHTTVQLHLPTLETLKLLKAYTGVKSSTHSSLTKVPAVCGLVSTHMAVYHWS